MLSVLKAYYFLFQYYKSFVTVLFRSLQHRLPTHSFDVQVFFRFLSGLLYHLQIVLFLMSGLAVLIRLILTYFFRFDSKGHSRFTRKLFRKLLKCCLVSHSVLNKNEQQNNSLFCFCSVISVFQVLLCTICLLMDCFGFLRFRVASTIATTRLFSRRT